MKSSDFEIVCMIYKSVRYLEFMADQLEKHAAGANIRFISNDGTTEVNEWLQRSPYQWNLYQDPNPNAYYLCRCYRCMNWYLRNSKYSKVVVVDSDMALSHRWLEALLKHADDETLPVSRLVQPDSSGSVPWGVYRDFGVPGSFREAEWLEFASGLRVDSVKPGGLYAPRVIDTKWFRTTPGFPEGNVLEGVALDHEDFSSQPGDNYFFSTSGKKHVTVFDSVVCHIWEGEFREK